MDWKELVWTAVNSPVGITILATGVLFVLNKLYAKRPAWAKYQGTIIKLVREAEKAIPNDTPNQGLARFDQVLRLTLQVFAEAEGKQANPKEVAEIKEGIHIVHSDLESNKQI